MAEPYGVCKGSPQEGPPFQLGLGEVAKEMRPTVRPKRKYELSRLLQIKKTAWAKVWA